MCTITATELKTHFGKYVKLAQKEKIEVTHNGKVVFYLTPTKEERIERMKSIFGVLPNDIDLDSVDRE